VEATAMAGHREKRIGVGLVDLQDKKQFDAEARLLACLYATYLFGWDEMKSRREKEHIAQESCTLVCYDLGYKKITGKYVLEKWLQQIKASITQSSAKNVLKSSHKGTTSQTDRISATHPTYLHYLYRRAVDILGDDATFSEIATQMNLISTVDQRPTIHLNKDSLRRWFKKNKGKEKRAVFRPLLTEDHKQTGYNTFVIYVP